MRRIIFACLISFLGLSVRAAEVMPTKLDLTCKAKNPITYIKKRASFESFDFEYANGRKKFDEVIQDRISNAIQERKKIEASKKNS